MGSLADVLNDLRSLSRFLCSVRHTQPTPTDAHLAPRINELAEGDLVVTVDATLRRLKMVLLAIRELIGSVQFLRAVCGAAATLAIARVPLDPTNHHLLVWRGVVFSCFSFCFSGVAAAWLRTGS